MSAEQPEQPDFSEPQHPDYAVLEDLVVRVVDLPTQSASFDLQAVLAEVVDPQSVAHVAMMRAVGFLGIDSPAEMQARHIEVLRASMFWCEGFFLGAQMERSRG